VFDPGKERFVDLGLKKSNKLKFIHEVKHEQNEQKHFLEILEFATEISEMKFKQEESLRFLIKQGKL
jgi:hypothetical protein